MKFKGIANLLLVVATLIFTLLRGNAQIAQTPTMNNNVYTIDNIYGNWESRFDIFRGSHLVVEGVTDITYFNNGVVTLKGYQVTTSPHAPPHVGSHSNISYSYKFAIKSTNQFEWEAEFFDSLGNLKDKGTVKWIDPNTFAYRSTYDPLKEYLYRRK